jgi:hypothetical protein
MPHLAARRALTAALGLAAALALLPAHGIYKWVDEKGVTHFSDDPPPDKAKATKIEPKVTPPSSNVKPDDWKAKELDSRKQKLDREMKDDREKASAQRKADNEAARCYNARRNLDVLSREAPVFTLDDRGQRVYLEDKDRPARIAKWQKDVETHCGR